MRSTHDGQRHRPARKASAVAMAWVPPAECPFPTWCTCRQWASTRHGSGAPGWWSNPCAQLATERCEVPLKCVQWTQSRHRLPARCMHCFRLLRRAVPLKKPATTTTTSTPPPFATAAFPSPSLPPQHTKHPRVGRRVGRTRPSDVGWPAHGPGHPPGTALRTRLHRQCGCGSRAGGGAAGWAPAQARLRGGRARGLACGVSAEPGADRRAVVWVCETSRLCVHWSS